MAAHDSVLTIIRSVAGRIGINRPSAALTSTDPSVIQLVELLNEEGQELAARHAWEGLIREQTYTTLAAESQGALDGTIVTAANGFDHIINDTIWNRSTMLGPGGPVSPQGWQAIKGTGVGLTSPWGQYRIRQGNLYLVPAPPAGQTLAFEYVTRFWATDSTGATGKSDVTVDTDIPRLDSKLLKLGLRWRWKKEKKLEYAEDFASYEAAIVDAMGRDGTKATLRMDLYGRERKGPTVMIPPGSWPL